MNAEVGTEDSVIGPDGNPWRSSTESQGWTPRRQARTHDQVKSAVARARTAATTLRITESSVKDRGLVAVADALLERRPEILDANAHDVSAAGAARSPTLSATDVSRMADELRAWAAMPTPLGEILRKTCRTDDIQRQQVRVPIGVVAVLYEEQASDGIRLLGPLLKAGNAVLLRGSRLVTLTSESLTTIATDALTASGLPSSTLQLISSRHRASLMDVITARGQVDLLIPLLGPGMRAGVVPEATVPLLDLVSGKCHIYVDATADLTLAEQAVLASTVGRGRLTGAVGTVLVHAAAAAEFLPRLGVRLRDDGITCFGDSSVRACMPEHVRAIRDDRHADRGVTSVVLLVVENLQAALGHIANHGGGHTDAVITRDNAVAETFTAHVDSATVVINAPTTLGTHVDQAEPCAAYAAGRLTPRGPLGLAEFTTTQWIVVGDHSASTTPAWWDGGPR